MKKPTNNYAFVDSQNVNLGIQALGWKLDWKLETVLSPSSAHCSVLLKRTAKERITFMETLRGKLEYKLKNEKAPPRDGTQGSA